MILSVCLYFTLFALINVRAIMKYLDRNVMQCIISFVAGWMYTVCMWIPAVLQSAGRTTSKLVGPGVLPLPSWPEIYELSLHWSIELATIIVAELIAVRLVCVERRSTKASRFSEYDWKISSCILIMVGVAAMVFFPVDLTSRAATGQGILAILRSCLVCGLAILAYFRAFKSPWLTVVLATGVAILVAGNVRSPISVVIVAAVAGVIARGSIYRVKTLAMGVVLIVTATMVGAFMSDMRANITRHQGQSTGDLIRNIAADPIAAPFRAGIDTLDGYRFAQFAAKLEPSALSDLLSPLYTFIPRSIWVDKPDSLAVRLSTKYLGYKSSGQFLSPTGYLTVATGSYIVAILVLGFTVVLLVAFANFFSNTYWLTLVLVVTFRLFLNGTSFDIYYGLTLLLPTIVAVASCRVFVAPDRGVPLLTVDRARDGLVRYE